MFWRRAKHPLTPDEKRDYEDHRARLLIRHRGHLTPGLIRCLEANASKLARHPEIRTRKWGLNMRGKRAAKAAHTAIRNRGGTPGDQGRAAMKWNREARGRDREEGRSWRVGHTLATQFPF
jgi:hypothetical protein